MKINIYIWRVNERTYYERKKERSEGRGNERKDFR
jgi:hypothetical protein